MTIPNFITIIRILLIPLFLLAFWSNGNIKLSMLIFLFAGLSDILDGYLARKLNAVSNLGKILDPIADKLIVITALVSLFLINRMPFWIVALVILKEIVMVLGGSFLIIRMQRDIAANIFGKLGTVSLFLAIFSQAFILPLRFFFTLLAGLMSILALINYIYLHINYEEIG